MMYDYLIVGSGFFGSTFARLVTDLGFKCLIIEKRNHIGGNVYTSKFEDIDVHEYGPHIFHTNNKDIWDFVNKFAKFNNFINRPKAVFNNKIYSLPFNMNTFHALWQDVITPEQAKQRIKEQTEIYFANTQDNLELHALRTVGTDIYNILIKEYTEKQWGKNSKDLPSSIIKRLPLRFTYDDNYFNDLYQGIPIDGYTSLFDNLLSGIEVKLNVDFFENKSYWKSICKKIVFTGKIDEWFNYEYGKLEYRTLEFEKIILNKENYQGNAVINYTNKNIPYTRIIEHKHFKKTNSINTIITKEFPSKWKENSIPYYPINDYENNKIYNKYKDKALTEKNVLFGGRLAEYQYYDMHQVIGSAMKSVKKELYEN